jgi:hypothetical protein
MNLGTARLRIAILMAGGSLAAVSASAQVGVCATPRSYCAAARGQTAGTACQCPANPPVKGRVVTADDGEALPEQDRDRPRRRELSNDDLEDSDDVLAGPRHHRPRSEDGDQR